jgi:hypothetical protein
VENEARRKCRSVMRNASRVRNPQGLMRNLNLRSLRKGLSPKEECVDQGLGGGGAFVDSPGAMASSLALRAATAATLA